MAFDYDTLDAAPTSAIAMTQSTVWIDGAPWRIFELHVPVKSTEFFTRSGAIGSADLKTYDMGRVFLATEGCENTNDHGYLEVEYEIELLDKQAGSSSSIGTGANASFNLPSDKTVTTGGTTITFDEEISNTLGVVNTSGVFTVPVSGVYLVLSDLVFGGTMMSAELLLDGASLVPPVEFGDAAGRAASLSTIVDLTLNQTLEIEAAASSVHALQDECRINIVLLART
jgi:hypothetical protein